MNRRRDTRLVPIAVATWGAALAAIMLPEAARWVALVLWGAALAGVWAIIGVPRMRRGGVAVALLCVALAGATVSHVAFAAPGRSAAADLSIQGGRAIEVTGVVSTKVERGFEGGVRFHADASLVRIGGERLPVAVPVSVTVAADDAAREGGPTGMLDLGAKVLVRGTAIPADPGERAVLVVFASGVEVARAPAGPLALSSAMRSAFIETVSGLPEPGSGLLPGLAVGDTRAVGAELDAAMKASSLAHLTAVSGANCAIVVGLAFMAAAAVGAPRAVRVVLALAALGGFVVLVTPEPSVIRAGAMAAVAMLAVLLGRPGAGLAVLCLAVTVLLVCDPWLAASLSFALSAVATGALLVLAPPLARGLERWMPRALALALAVPLAAQLACGPLIVLVSPTVPLYGVLANLVAGPAAPVATIVGLAACLAAPLPWLAGILAAIAWVPSAWIAATAQTLAALPAAIVPWLEGWWGVAALAALGAALAVAIARAGRAEPADVVLRVTAIAGVAATAGVLAGGALLGGAAGPLTVPHAWSIAACDVGQGDAVVVRSADRVALIDTGPDPDPLEACLARLGIAHVDLLVLTHFDLDHVGGAAAVAGRVGIVLHAPPATAEQEAVVASLRERGAEAVRASAGQAGGLGDASWRVLWPRGESHAYREGNDGSVVLEVSGGHVPHSIFLGDLSAEAQRALAATGRLSAPYDVVKVAHHGSADQDAAFYAALSPAVALITVGQDNTHGHPRDEVLEILDQAGAVVARTDEEGLVSLSGVDEGIAVWREHAPP